MTQTVTIIDYGMGNILSVSRAFETCGAEVLLSNLSEDILSAQYLVLPGVGAFKDGMKELHDRGLIEPIKTKASQGVPFLGICLGMQMMFETSEEFGTHEGLGIVPGKVVAIPQTSATGSPHKIPHIGWNQLTLPSPRTSWEESILQNIASGASVYFVHSFTAVPTADSHRLADARYNGRLISACIRSGLLYGCQFHPEKSGPIGLNIIKNFLSLSSS